jgi:hypothetical protein
MDFQCIASFWMDFIYKGLYYIYIVSSYEMRVRIKYQLYDENSERMNRISR